MYKVVFLKLGDYYVAAGGIAMQRKKLIYEIVMMVLALVVVAIVIIQLSLTVPVKIDNVLVVIDNMIWFIFLADYSIRLYRAESKKYFVLHNKIDLITIIPFNSLFRALRILKIAKLLKVLRLTRGLLFLSRFTNRMNCFIKTNNFNYVLSGTVITIFIGAGAISVVENMRFTDAIWWSFVTATTVGYGDISPTTLVGRIIASLLMIVGISFIGMLTGTISTYFMSKGSKSKTYKDEVLEGIKERLDDFENISKEDLAHMCKVMMELKDTQS